MQFNLTMNTEATKTAKQLRQELIESILVQMTDDIASGTYPMELAVKAVAPLVDTLHTGTRSAGHADKLKELVRDNLEQAIAARDSAAEAPSDADKGVAKGKAKAA